MPNTRIYQLVPLCVSLCLRRAYEVFPRSSGGNSARKKPTNPVTLWYHVIWKSQVETQRPTLLRTLNLIRLSLCLPSHRPAPSSAFNCILYPVTSYYGNLGIIRTVHPYHLVSFSPLCCRAGCIGNLSSEAGRSPSHSVSGSSAFPPTVSSDP